MKMTSRHFWIFILAFCCIKSAVAHGQIQETTEALKMLEAKVQTAKLSNGLRVIIYPRPIAPVFSGVVAARVGGTDEKPGQSGIAHLLEHMAFKGTPEIGSRNFQEENKLLNELEKLANSNKSTLDELRNSEQWQTLMDKLRTLWVTDQFTMEYEKRGAVGMNAYTTSEITAYFSNMPRNVFEFWCFMESERIARPVMRQFYEERDVVLEERRMRFEADPEGKLYELLLGAAFQIHPYGKPVIGYESDLRKLTATDISRFHSQFYVPSQLVISLVGDVSLERDLPIIEKYFGRIKKGAEPGRPEAKEPPQTAAREIILNERASPQTNIAYHKPVYPHPDDAVISIMTEILSGSKLSPLYRNMVEQQRVAVSVNASEAPGNAYPNILIFQLVPRTPNDNNSVIDAFDRVVQDFQENFDDDNLLEIAKRSVAMSYLGTLKSGQSMALALASDELIYNNWRASLDWFESITKVTTAQVREASRKYLNKNSRTIARLESKEAL